MYIIFDTERSKRAGRLKAENEHTPSKDQIMATFQQISEESRPPESPNRKLVNRKSCPNTSVSSWLSDSNRHPYLSPDSDSIQNKSAEFNNNVFFEVNTELMDDLNKNVRVTLKRNLPASNTSNKVEKSSLKQSLPKLLCLRKSSSASCNKAWKTLNVNALRTDNFNLNNNNKYFECEESASRTAKDSNLNGASPDDASSSQFVHRQKNRNILHQNVEEALNSLLWQPYEYQNNRTSPSSPSYSSCSCSPSSSCDDLDEITKNDGTSVQCSFTDLHLPTPTSEMVINLQAKNPIDQSGPHFRSRDALTNRSTSWLSEHFSYTESSRETRQRVVNSDPNVSDVNRSDMQVNVSSNVPSASQSNVLNISTADNGLRTNISSQNQQNIFQNVNSTNLSSANVVGLPNHARYASVPVGTVQSRPAGNGNNVFPNHPRHISEPSNQFTKFNNNSLFPQPGNSVPTHYRHSSQVDQNNLQQISHSRSCSVPKSMPVVARHESSTTTTTTTVPSSNIHNTRFSQKINPQVPSNISNVNVNFYRAVPVNVVSSVPTIHCLNTLSNVQGNEVSNVQVLPLGSNYLSPPPNSFATTRSNHQDPSFIIGTTQVILHNTQGNTNSIQIPSQNTFNRATIFDLQASPGTSTISTNTMTNYISPPSVTLSDNQILIHNTRPISSTIVPPSNPQFSLGTRTNSSINTIQVLASTQPPVQSRSNNETRTAARTFTSTEAQTDEISVLPSMSNESSSSSGAREQRRRERRERRHHRRSNGGTHRHSSENGSQTPSSRNDRLPDLLNSHQPPPYTTFQNGVPVPQQTQGGMGSMSPLGPNPAIVSPQMLPPPHGPVLQTVIPNIVPPSGFVFQGPPPGISGQVPLVQGPAPMAVPLPAPSGFRFPFPANGFRRGRFTEEPPKGCCGLLSWKPGSLRWFIALIALVAVCCVLVGTALGAMRPSGRDHLTISLLMIGVGIVLVTVSGVAWRLTSHDSSTCRSMLGLGSTESVDVCTRRFVPRLPPSYGRPHHPYAAMMYPEFQYRPPPPSYQASMQEYRLRLLLLERGNTPQIQAGIQNALSPPPTYRSHAGSLLRAPLSSRREAAQSEYSCPPSYRSNSTNRQGTLQNNSVLHSREQSLSLSESNQGSVVNVVNILGSTEEDIALDNITLDSLKMEPEHDMNPLKMLLKGSSNDLEGSKDGNLVTIVQTSDQSPVIVTVSGSSQIDNNSSVQITEIPSEMEILAHL